MDQKVNYIVVKCTFEQYYILHMTTYATKKGDNAGGKEGNVLCRGVKPHEIDLVIVM